MDSGFNKINVKLLQALLFASMQACAVDFSFGLWGDMPYEKNKADLVTHYSIINSRVVVREGKIEWHNQLAKQLALGAK